MTREIDLIKERLDLVDFLRSYLKLLPAGKNFKALCPFHQEKIPSFIVSPERKIWHCFGACSEGGDIIKFVMKYENLAFPEALRFLAEKAGITISPLSPAEQKQFGILYDIHEAAKDFYKKELSKNKAAYEYLKERGLLPQTIEEFELGFAPGSLSMSSGQSEALTLHLIKLGFDVSDIERAGLAHKNTKGLYRDRFQGRLIFPILNSVGKTIAFTGRLLEISTYQNGESKDQNTPALPKYLNSPETPIFAKSRILYGFNKSKSEIARSRTVFIVEGQMDFLLAWQAGVRNVVALSGTGLTHDHLTTLKRIADTVILSFDNDEAGLRALERALDIFSSYDFHTKVIDLGDFKDPAEAVKTDRDFLRRAINAAKPAFSRLFEYYFDPISVKEKLKEDIVYKKRVLRNLLIKIRNIKSEIEQNIWLKELSRHSGISEPALLGELENLPSESETQTKELPVSQVPERVEVISARLLALVFSNQELKTELASFKEWLPQKFQEILDKPEREETGFLELQGSYEFGEKDILTLRKEFDELVKQLQIESLKAEMEKLRQEIRLAEGRGNEQELADVMVRFNVLARKINELK